MLSTAYHHECLVTPSRCAVVICGQDSVVWPRPAPLPFAALAVLGFTQRWRVGFELAAAALGAGEEAFSFRLLLLFSLQTWVWVRKG